MASISATSFSSAVPVDDPRPVEVVGRQLDAHSVPRQDPDPETAHLSGDVTEHYPVHVVELDAKHCVRQGLDDLAFKLDFLFLRHKRGQR